MLASEQLSEVNEARRELAVWLGGHPDGPMQYDIALERLTMPAATALGWGETEIRSVLALEPVLGMLRGLAYERAARGTWPGGADTPLQDFLAQRARYLRPAGSHYMRALAEASTELYEVVRVDAGRSIVVRCVTTPESERSVHEFSASKTLSPGQYLLTEVLPMPNGRLFSAGIFPIDDDRIGRLDGLRGESLLCQGVTEWAIPIFRLAASLLGLTARDRSAEPVSGARPEESMARESMAEKSTPDESAAEDPVADLEPDSRERLLDRIRKLYAMAQQTEASPHEAEIALRRCQSLMARFGITEADLETSDLTTDIAWKKKRVPMHVQDLAMAVGKLHDVLFVLGYDACPEFRGFQIDVRVAKLTLDYLVDATERALAKRRRAGNFPAGRSAAYDYRRAFADEVGVRIDAIVKEREREEQSVSITGTALTVRKREIVERECGQNLTTSYSRTRGARHADAVAAGREDGARVSLDAQVERAGGVLTLPEP